MVFGGEDESRRRKTEPRFKGVRMRKWGRWVSKIRVPNSQARIWLGSYDSAEAAARAYDAALYCLRGPAASFNFGCGKRPDFPGGVPTELAFTEIKSIAARFASLSGAMPASSASTTATATWEQHAMSDGNDLWDVCSTFAVPRAPLLDGVTIGDISYLWSS